MSIFWDHHRFVVAIVYHLLKIFSSDPLVQIEDYLTSRIARCRWTGGRNSTSTTQYQHQTHLLRLLNIICGCHRYSLSVVLLSMTWFRWCTHCESLILSSLSMGKKSIPSFKCAWLCVFDNVLHIHIYTHIYIKRERAGLVGVCANTFQGMENLYGSQNARIGALELSHHIHIDRNIASICTLVYNDDYFIIAPPWNVCETIYWTTNKILHHFALIVTDYYGLVFVVVFFAYDRFWFHIVIVSFLTWEKVFISFIWWIIQIICDNNSTNINYFSLIFLAKFVNSDRLSQNNYHQRNRYTKIVKSQIKINLNQRKM